MRDWDNCLQTRVFLALGDELDKLRGLCLPGSSVLYYNDTPVKNSSCKTLLTVRHFGSGVSEVYQRIWIMSLCSFSKLT